MKLYFIQRISPNTIAQHYNCSGRTIRSRLTDFGIPRLGPTHLRKGKSAIWNVGLIRSPETREKNRRAHLGCTPINKGQGSIAFVCEVCSARVTDKPYRRKRTCSTKCRAQLSHIFRGENHWNFKSHNPAGQQRQRHWAEIKEWRCDVMKLANYTCSKCSTRGGKLTAHHIHGWSQFPHLRFAISNGACLCLKCHRIFHSLFGQRRFTADSFISWVGLPCSMSNTSPS